MIPESSPLCIFSQTAGMGNSAFLLLPLLLYWDEIPAVTSGKERAKCNMSYVSTVVPHSFSPQKKKKAEKKSVFCAKVWRGSVVHCCSNAPCKSSFFFFFGESEVRVVCSVPWCSELWALGIGESSEVKDLHEKKNQKTRQGIASTGKQSKVAHYLIGKLFWFIFPNAFVLSFPHLTGN